MGKKITLKKLVLSNWRGQNHEIVFNEGATRISGVNGCGKTSIMASWYWLLAGVTEPHNPKNFNLFDNRVELTHETPLAKVKAWIKIGDYDYTIEKTAEAKFSRPKGSSEWVKSTSDTYTVYIDEIETSATQFNEWISNNICPVAMLPYCLSGDFFSYLITEDKNKARKILCDIVGEIKEEDFKGDYSSIAELLLRYTASDIVEMSRKKKKPLEDRQNVIPNEIDSKEERLSELKAMDFSTYEKEIENTKERIETIDGLLLGNADAIKPILEHNREIENKVAILRRYYLDGKMELEASQNATRSEIKAKIAEIKRYNEGIDKENAKTKRDFEEEIENGTFWSKRIDILEEKRAELLKKRDEVKARVYTEEKCAYCGQELPYDMLEKAREKFNERKAKDLELIVKEGKQVAEDIARAKEKIESIGKMVEEGYTLLEKKSTTELEDALERFERGLLRFEDSGEAKQLNAQIEALLSEMKETPSNDNDALTREKKGLIEQLSELSKKIGLKGEIEKVENDIIELKKELRSVANSIAELEGLIYTAQSWLQERNEITALRINDKMKIAKLEMWSTQKNGEQTPDLILVNDKDIKFNSTNFANQIELKLDLQELFCKTFGVNMPRFIDESAVFSPSNLPKFDDTQAIYLFASDEPSLNVY